MSQVVRFMGWSCPVYLPAFKNTSLQSVTNSIPTRDMQTMPINDDDHVNIYISTSVDTREKSQPRNRLLASLFISIKKGSLLEY